MPRRRYSLTDCNARLDAANVGLKILQRGDRLSLRGTLPPKPGAKSTRHSQQTISLGVRASPAGFEYAESKALEYGALLAQRRFSWLDIDRPAESKDTCEAWVAAFRQAWQRDQ
ncbi:MAG TPA: integrase, partial [Candidatus Paceibacterota bacterium]|nr:integrase [Candidatus Paceibacterota bacterium]